MADNQGPPWVTFGVAAVTMLGSVIIARIQAGSTAKDTATQVVRNLQVQTDSLMFSSDDFSNWTTEPSRPWETHRHGAFKELHFIGDAKDYRFLVSVSALEQSHTNRYTTYVKIDNGKPMVYFETWDGSDITRAEVTCLAVPDLR